MCPIISILGLEAVPPCPSSLLCIQLVRLPSSLASAPKWSHPRLSTSNLTTLASLCLDPVPSSSAASSVSQSHPTHCSLKILSHISLGSFYPGDKGPVVTSLRKLKRGLVFTLPAPYQSNLRRDSSKHTLFIGHATNALHWELAHQEAGGYGTSQLCGSSVELLQAGKWLTSSSFLMVS